MQYLELFSSKYKMLSFFTWGILLSSAVVQGSYQYYPLINGWVQEHRVIATWDEAFRRCKAEGAILMSPITTNLLTVMRSRAAKNISYFIGANARFHSGLFVSLEGIPLEDMPVMEMLGKLDSNDGHCLSLMNRQSIRIVPCSARLPFMCYKQRNDGFNITECGTTDKEYKLSKSTGSCYKFHSTLTTWNEAYSTCILEGGYLVVVNDNNEAKEVLKFMVKDAYYVHTGLKDWNGKGDWMSIFGDSVHDIYNVWKNNSQPAEPCCQIGAIAPSSGMLKGFEEGVQMSFMCEKDPDNIRFSSRLQQLLYDDRTNPLDLQ